MSGFVRILPTQLSLKRGKGSLVRCRGHRSKNYFGAPSHQLSRSCFDPPPYVRGGGERGPRRQREKKVKTISAWLPEAASEEAMRRKEDVSVEYKHTGLEKIGKEP